MITFYEKFSKWYTKLLTICIHTFWCEHFNCKANFENEMQISAKRKNKTEVYDVTEID